MINLTRKQKQDIDDTISELTVISVRKNGRKIWDCSCGDLNSEFVANIEAINTKLIVNEILEILGHNDE